METVDVVDAIVIGAGVVGLAVGRAMAATGKETLVIERNRRIGEETSSRNSCVVHSGIYYPTDSQKARLCIRGRELLYDYSIRRNVWHKRCGKLIVAQHDQLPALRSLHAKGIENGVTDLRWLHRDEARDLEPDVRCDAALFSPSTGIIDVHDLMTALLGDMEAAGGMLVLNSTVQHVRPIASGYEVSIRSGNDETTVIARHLEFRRPRRHRPGPSDRRLSHGPDSPSLLGERQLLLVSRAAIPTSRVPVAE